MPHVPVRVSIYCGAQSTCGHSTKPLLHRVTCTPSAEKITSLSSSLQTSMSFPDLSDDKCLASSPRSSLLASTTSLVASPSSSSSTSSLSECGDETLNTILSQWPSTMSSSAAARLSSYIASLVSCDIVMIFSSSETFCCDSTRACVSDQHIIEYAGLEESDGAGAFTPSCAIANHPLIRASMAHNNVIISNDVNNDLRLERALETRHQNIGNVKIHSMMVVPLLVSGERVSGDGQHAGVVVCLNSNRVQSRDGDDDDCAGFAVQDYVPYHHVFSRVAIHLFIAELQSQVISLRDDRATLERQHKRDVNQAMLSRDTFVATMSHEIRTPLNAINGYTELMLRKFSSSPRIDDGDVVLVGSWLRKQRDATLQLTRLLANILDYAKLRSNSVRLQTRAFSFRRFLGNIVDLMSEACHQKNIELSTRVDDSVPEEIIGDETRLYQVLVNLITNAITHTLHGNIIVSVSCSNDNEEETPGEQHTPQVPRKRRRFSGSRRNSSQSIDIAGAGDSILLTISVSDTGKGIPKHLQEKIFGEFDQIRDSTMNASSLQGVGLGLAISRELVTLMDGTIGVESDGRSGSTFTFTARVRDPGNVARLLEKTKSLMTGGAVLIVDDGEVNRIRLAQTVLSWQLSPQTCSSVDEALSFLGAFPDNHFRVVLIDIDLGDGKLGTTLARLIRRNAKYNHLLLIATSSMGTSFSGHDMFDSVHEKPLNTDDLLSDITRLLQRQRHRAGSTETLLSSPIASMLREDVGGMRAAPPSPLSSPSSMTLGRAASLTASQLLVAPDVLIVDDDDMSLTYCQEALTQIGHRSFDIARDGVSALIMLKERRFSCILLDVIMPRMSGIDCIAHIREDPDTYGDPYICVVTADAVDATRTDALRVGANDCVEKPLGIEQIHSIIERAIAHTKEREEAEETMRITSGSKRRQGRRTKKCNRRPTTK